MGCWRRESGRRQGVGESKVRSIVNDYPLKLNEVLFFPRLSHCWLFPKALTIQLSHMNFLRQALTYVNSAEAFLQLLFSRLSCSFCSTVQKADIISNAQLRGFVNFSRESYPITYFMISFQSTLRVTNCKASSVKLPGLIPESKFKMTLKLIGKAENSTKMTILIDAVITGEYRRNW